MRHRGPDDEGYFIDNHLGLGHRRLSIIDLSEKGKQPMGNENGDILVIYNGEIYNYIELRKELKAKGHKFRSDTDTEVILHAYEEHGFECLKQFNGMFSFALYDRNKGLLFCARDRYGIKPFYYYKDDKRFIFASEIKAILQDDSIPRKQNDKIIYDYLVFNRFDHSEQTFFENIYRLLPSHYLVIKNNKMKIEKWWKTEVREKNKSDLHSSSAEFGKLFKDSVRLRLRSDVPVGSCLSGGLDSSSIVCTVNELIKERENFQTFSAVYDREWERDETEFIEMVLARTGFKGNYTSPDGKTLLEHLETFIYSQEEPLGHSSFFAQWMVMRLARDKKIKVLLDGQGGDELMAGYMYMFGFYYYELFRKKKFLTLMNEMMGTYRNHRNIAGFYLFLFLLASRSVQEEIAHKVSVGSEITLRKWLARNFSDRYKGTSEILEDFINSPDLNNALQKHIVHKLEHLLRCEDKNSMAFSIETRLPFLDYRLVDFMFSLPSKFKINKGTTKVILREAMKDTLPEKITYRKSKFGFETKDDDWFRSDDFKKLTGDIIDSQSFRGRPYYDVPEVKKELQLFYDGKKNISRTIWKWINLELWLRMYIDGDKVNKPSKP